MTTRLRFATICAGTIALAIAWAGDDYPDDYEGFAKAGVFDPEVSNTKANELVSEGLFSGDPRLVRLTLEALAAHSHGQRLGTVVGRDFSKVPQLKEFLTEHWRKRISEGDLSRTIEDMGDYLDRTPRTDEPHSMFVRGVANIRDWVLIPSILAASFPGDEHVHDLLWEYYSLSQDVPLDGWILGFFNEGRFTTPEVDRLRIDHVGSENRATAVLAAEGLALSKPDGGLEALMSALRKYPDRESFLADAMVSYGPEAIPLLDEAGLERISSKIVRVR